MAQASGMDPIIRLLEMNQDHPFDSESRTQLCLEIDQRLSALSLTAAEYLLHLQNDPQESVRLLGCLKANTPSALEQELEALKAELKQKEQALEDVQQELQIALGEHGKSEEELIRINRQLLKANRELRLREVDLKISEETFRTSFLNAPIGMVLCDMQGKIKQTNQAFRHMLGYSEEALEGLHFKDITHPGDHELNSTFFNQLVSRKIDQYQMEKRYLHKNGSIVYGLISINISTKRNGDPSHMVAQVLDVTQERKSKEEIAEKQRLYKLVTENSTDVVSLFDADQNIIYLSPSIESTLGYTVEEIQEFGILTLVHPDDQDRVQSEIEYTTTNAIEDSRYTCRMRQKSGHYKWMEVVAKREFLPNGKIHQTIANLRDVTIQVVAENRLKESEMLYRLLAESSTDLICLHDIDGTFVYVSPSIRELLGYEPEELIGRSAFSLFRFQDLEGYPQQRDEFFFDGDGVNVEYRIRKKDRNWIWMNTVTTPVRNELGEVIQFQSASRDITERKEAEASLIEAKEKAEQAVVVKQQFLSNISHEIRTPMNAVIGITHLLEQEQPRSDQREHLETLKFSAENLLMLINDILDYAKIEEGKIIFEENHFTLSNLFTNLYQSFREKAANKGIQLNFSKEDKLPDQLIGDSGRLSQILYNLLDNALKFTMEGNVSLYVKALEHNEKDICLEFSVEDTGVGIPPEKLSIIFDRFRQADSDTNRKFGGTGLGLAITKRLLELQGGTYQVSSEVNQGTCFSFTLRLGLEPAGQMEMVMEEKMVFRSLENVRLLLVEDNKVNQMVAVKFLNKWDIHPDLAEDGLQALELIENNEYDVVLMDLQMPRMDGYTATRKIREFEAQLPIIALTASAMAETRDKVLQIGMTDYISKPFKPSDLYLMIMKYGQLNRKTQAQA